VCSILFALLCFFIGLLLIPLHVIFFLHLKLILYSLLGGTYREQKLKPYLKLQEQLTEKDTAGHNDETSQSEENGNENECRVIDKNILTAVDGSMRACKQLSTMSYIQYVGR
jgi:hypothetical protein